MRKHFAHRWNWVLLFAVLLPCRLVAEPGPDPLPRRAFLGVRIDSDKSGRTIIREIFPGSSAAASQLKVGDALLKVDDKSIVSASQFLSVLAAYRAGNRVTFHVEREAESVLFEIPLVEWPREKSAEFDILYDVVESGTAKLRSIITKPSGAVEQRWPAVLFIQGIDCDTIERPFGSPDNMRELVYGLTRAGYAVMRCEKSGVGDSSGEPCKSFGLLREVEDFTAALKKLKSYAFVDSDNVFLFGISAGGWVGPLVASRELPKGIVVYGTVTRPFSEYLIENHRRNKWLRRRPDPVELEQETRRMSRFMHYLLVEKRERAEILRAYPELGDVGKHIFSEDDSHPYGVRTVDYFREIQEQDIPKVWSRLGIPVLALIGEFEIRTTAFDHEHLANIINFHHPGLATWKQVPRADHGLALHVSMADSVKNEFKGPFANQVLLESVKWMNEVAATIRTTTKRQASP